jgi:hypothetical protein
MTNSVKIGLISFCVVGIGVGTYFLVQYLKLKKAYNTTLSENAASNLIQSKTSGIPDALIPDEITASINQDENASNGVVAEDDSPSVSSDYQYPMDLQLFETQTGMGDY